MYSFCTYIFFLHIYVHTDNRHLAVLTWCICRAIGMMIFTLLWPIWPFLMQLSLVAYWGASCLFLASTSKQIFGVTNSSELSTNATFDWTATSTTTQATVS